MVLGGVLPARLMIDIARISPYTQALIAISHVKGDFHQQVGVTRRRPQRILGTRPCPRLPLPSQFSVLNLSSLNSHVSDLTRADYTTTDTKYWSSTRRHVRIRFTTPSCLCSGWRNLPTELKLEIMTYVLTHNRTFDIDILTEAAQKHKRPYTPDPKVQRLCAFLDYPDFSALTPDALIMHNFISIKSRLPERLYPKDSLVDRIQHLQITVPASEIDLVWFSEFAQGKHGVGNVRSVRLIIDVTRRKQRELNAFGKHVAIRGLVELGVTTLSRKFRGPVGSNGRGNGKAQTKELEAVVADHAVKRGDVAIVPKAG